MTKIIRRITSYIIILFMIGLVFPIGISAEDNIPSALSQLSGSTNLPIKELSNTAGQTLSSGIYYIKDNIVINSDKTSDNGLSIASNATVFLYIPADKTLTVYGKDATTNASKGSNAVSPTLYVKNDTYTYTKNSRTSKVTGPRVYLDDATIAGAAGATAATYGYAAIYVPSSAKFAVFGDGALNAIGGKGGNGNIGGAGAKTAHGITTMRMYSTSKKGEGTYWLTDIDHPSTNGTAMSLTWVTKGPEFFSNKNTRLYAGAGGGGGAGAGGGGAAVGTNGTSGTVGTVGATPSVKSSTNDTHTFYNYTTPTLAKAAEPTKANSASSSGLIYIASSVNVSGTKAGDGGTTPSNSSETAKVSLYTRSVFTDWGSASSKANTYVQVADGQKGGAGGKGGQGALFGQGGQGGQGGYGGDGGIGTNTNIAITNIPKSGSNGENGADGSSTKNTLTTASMPYYTVTYKNPDGSVVATQKYYLGQSTTLTIPSNSISNFIGWKVTGGASAPLDNVFGSGSAFLVGDDNLYLAGNSVTLGKGTMGDVTLTADCKDLVTINITKQDYTYDGNFHPGYTSVTNDKSLADSDLSFVYVGINSTTYGPTLYQPINAGDYKLTVSVPDSNPDYYGSNSVNFKINKKDGSVYCTIDPIPVQNYTGHEIEPPLTVKDGTKVLTEGIDYTVRYENNINEGDSAKAIVSYNGNYTGESEKLFTIKNLPPEIGVGFTINYFDETIIVWDGYTVKRGDVELHTGDTIYPEEVLGVSKGNSGVTLNTLPARPATPAPPELLNRTDTTITLKKVSGQAYKIESNAWKDSTLFEGLTENTTYTFSTYIKATDHSFKSLEASADFATYDTLTTYVIPPSSIKVTFDGRFINKSDEDEDFSENQVAYFDHANGAGHDVDVDFYFYNNTENKTLEQETTYRKDLITGSSDVTLGFTETGLPYGTFSAVEEYQSEPFKTHHYIFPDANGNNYVEMVFWMGDETGSNTNDTIAIEYIVNNVTTIKKYKVDLEADDVEVTYGESYNVNVTSANMPIYDIDVTPAYNYKYYKNSSNIEKPVNAGDYTGKVFVDDEDPIFKTGTEADFNIKINPKPLTESNITDMAAVTYNGSIQKPNVVVTDNSKTLVLGTDYNVTFKRDNVVTDDFISAGIIAVCIEGINNYTGTPFKNYIINPKSSLGNDAITISETGPWVYTGSEQTPAVTVNDSSKVLTENVDYTLLYENNINVGTATIKAILKGNYDGVPERDFEITPKLLTEDMVFVSLDNNTYTSSTLSPTILAKYGNITLTSSDYDVSGDTNGTDVDSYTVSLTGKGNYYGTINKNWNIVKAPQDAPELLEGFSIDYINEKITIDANYEVSTNKDFTTLMNTNDTVLPGNTYYVRKAEDANHYASLGTENILPERRQAPVPELLYRSGDHIELEIISDVNYRMDGGAWQASNSFSVSDTDEHSFEIYYPATSSEFASEIGDAESFYACDTLDSVGEMNLSSTLSMKAPNFCIGENGIEDDFDDYQEGYYFIGSTYTDFEEKTDFDIYYWSNDEDNFTLAEAVYEEMDGYGLERNGANFCTVGVQNIPAVWYEMEETFEGETYITRTYIVADSDEEFVEIVFWKSGTDADNQIANIVDTIYTTKKFTVKYDGVLASDNVEYNSLLTKPSDPTKEGKLFVGWYTDVNHTQVWNYSTDRVLKNINFYSDWVNEDEPVKHIEGNITMDSNNVEGAIVELWRGIDKLATTTSDSDGNYSFSNIRGDFYNIVVRKDLITEERIKTIMVIINDDSLNYSIDIELPSKSVNSILEHTDMALQSSAKADILHSTVACIDGVAESKNPTSVEHYNSIFNVVPDAVDDEEKAAIKNIAGGKTLEYFNLSLSEAYENDSMPDNNYVNKDIGDENDILLFTCIPFNFSNMKKDSVVVYRYHNSSVSPLTRVSEIADDTEGTYYINEEDGFIKINSKKYSTFAIGYDSNAISSRHIIPNTGIDIVIEY